MSTPVCPNEGELDQLVTLKTATWNLKLFTAVSGGVSNTSVAADFTEATFPGYSSTTQTLAYGTPSTVSGTGTMTATPISFVHSAGAGSETILGYYIVNASTGKVEKAETWDTPVVMASNGDTITITEKYLCAGTITS